MTAPLDYSKPRKRWTRRPPRWLLWATLIYPLCLLALFHFDWLYIRFVQDEMPNPTHSGPIPMWLLGPMLSAVSLGFLPMTITGLVVHVSSCFDETKPKAKRARWLICFVGVWLATFWIFVIDPLGAVEWFID